MNEAIYVLERGERDDFDHQIISDPNKGPSNILFVVFLKVISRIGDIPYLLGKWHLALQKSNLMKDSAVTNTYFYIKVEVVY